MTTSKKLIRPFYLKVPTLILFSIMISIIYFFIIFIIVDIEGANLEFYNEVHKLATVLKLHKQATGKYPKSLSEIRQTGKICINKFYRRCRKIYYKASNDFESFGLATKTTDNTILFYHPEISVSLEEYRALSDEDIEERIRKYGLICIYCEALPENASTENTRRIIYRKSPRVFPFPDEWPRI